MASRTVQALVIAAMAVPAYVHQVRAQAATPTWADQVVGVYVGRDHNAGELQCEQIEFALQDGVLVGHYRIEDDPPFEGDLAYLGPDTDTGDAADGPGGRFLWSDRDGSGIRVIRFAPGFASFRSLWGRTVPDPRLTGYGRRGVDATVPGCGGPTS